MRDRALAALYGLAIGDALGMPTQMLSPDAVRAQFGSITGFEPAGAGRQGDRFHHSGLGVTEVTNVSYLAATSVIPATLTPQTPE